MYFSDATQLAPKNPRKQRTVVIGGGAVGLYAATLLASRGHDVIVIEAGDSQLGRFDSDSWESVGRAHSGIRLGRSRNLGGTTGLWGGQLVEFQPIDFAGRDWLPGSKWPLPYEEVAPYYRPTYLNLGIPAELIDDDAVWRGSRTKKPDPGPDLEVFFTRWMETPNFAKLFAGPIQTDPKLAVLVGHTAVGFRGSDRRVTEVRVVDDAGKSYSIAGDRFLLAAGTIENSRLLLHAAQDPLWPAPWRNNANVGRYFQDHLSGSVGSFLPSDKRRFFLTFANLIYARHKFQPKIRMRNDILVGERTYNIQGFFAFESEISEHLVYLKQFLKAALYTRRLTGIGDVFRKGAGVFRFLVPLMWKYVWDHRVFVPGSARTVLLIQTEHAPCAESCVRIDPGNVDAFGLPRVILDWRLRGDELAGIRTFALRMRDALRAAGLGELRIEPALFDSNPEFMSTLGDMYHQSGGAIMGTSAEDGVVDRDLRVFGTENLYVGGASVFRTTSNANVTFTALALATRLVDHLTSGSQLTQPMEEERHAAAT